MNRLTKRVFGLVTALVFATGYSQGVVTGIVTDAETGSPLPGASVLVKGTSKGVSTDFDGNYSLDVPNNSGTLVVSYVGFTQKQVTYTLVGGKAKVNVVLTPDAQSLDEVVVVGTGLLDIAKERETPVAVSTIKAVEIQEKLGNQEFPEVLKTTPSVYATKQGGGFGDSSINIRGFDQTNIAVMVNGMPVNDMENGKVYWSNWAGISDVTTAMQVQRGLGASKLAIASVGGSVNIITKAANKSEGGRVFGSYSNDNAYKMLASYNTGIGKKGFAASVLLARDAGSKYADGTQYEGYNYFLALAYRLKKHDFQFMITGAPQWHNQRSYTIRISDAIKYGGSLEKPNRRYNSDWGYYKGEEFSNRKNYYHKPVMMLNWDWNMSDRTSLSTVAYASFGRGYGTGDAGKVNGKRIFQYRTAEGLYDFDKIAEKNKNANPLNEDVLIRRASVNSHNWYGVLSSLNHKLSDKLSFSGGIDARYYKGYHYRVVSDFIGATSYSDRSNKNLSAPNIVTNAIDAGFNFNPFGGNVDDISDRIIYSNDGEVKWLGFFGQLEYSTERLSAFIQSSWSNQGFQRIDNFLKEGTPVGKNNSTPMHVKTGFHYLQGYNVKGGANFNINEHNNIFGNIGYYERQPKFDAVYPNNKNFLNPYLENEKILGFELGYGFKYQGLNLNLNLYQTTWKDRNMRKVLKDNTDSAIGYADVKGVEEIHKGIELDARWRISEKVRITAMYSLGDWYYKGDAEGTAYDDQTNQVISGMQNIKLYLDDVKVGDSSQNTAAIILDWNPVKALRISGTWNYIDNLYSNFDPIYMTSTDSKGAILLPSYSLFDFGVSYKFRLGDNEKQYFTFRSNIYNAFDTYYLSSSYSNKPLKELSDFGGDQTRYNDYLSNNVYKGIDTSNSVFFGSGRTYNVSLSFNF